MLAMPSQAVNDAWHEFILFTRQYDKFCRHAFGRFLHHTPAEAMRRRRRPARASSGPGGWPAGHEGINPQKPERLPRLFALDATLGIAGGFVYQLDCMAARHGGDGTGYCASHIGCGGGDGGAATAVPGIPATAVAGVAAATSSRLRRRVRHHPVAPTVLGPIERRIGGMGQFIRHLAVVGVGGNTGRGGE